MCLSPKSPSKIVCQFQREVTRHKLERGGEGGGGLGLTGSRVKVPGRVNLSIYSVHFAPAAGIYYNKPLPHSAGFHQLCKADKRSIVTSLDPLLPDVLSLILREGGGGGIASVSRRRR